MKSEIAGFTLEERESLEVRGARVLRDAIIRGEFPAGELLHVSQVASLLQLSSTPVLGALKRLEAEGYVTIVPRRGFYVREMTFDDLEEITVVRAALESYAAAKGAAMATTGHLAVMQSHIDTIEKLLRSGTPSAAGSARIAELDTEFHLELITAADRPSLLENVNALRHRSRAYLSLCHDQILPRMHVSQNTHREILQACRNRDIPRVKELTCRHILQTTETLQPILSDISSGETRGSLVTNAAIEPSD